MHESLGMRQAREGSKVLAHEKQGHVLCSSSAIMHNDLLVIKFQKRLIGGQTLTMSRCEGNMGQRRAVAR